MVRGTVPFFGPFASGRFAAGFRSLLCRRWPPVSFDWGPTRCLLGRLLPLAALSRTLFWWTTDQTKQMREHDGVYDIFTERIIALSEQDIVPWQKSFDV